MVAFTSILSGIRTVGSYIEFSNIRTGNGLPMWQRRTLIMGQKLASGSAQPNVPIQVFSPLAGQALFGRGSMLDRMIQAVFAGNPSAQPWVMCAADPPGGAAATYTLTITAPPTAAGVLALYIGGQQVQVPITANMTLAQVATAIAAEVESLLDLPVSAAANAAVVTLTVNWLGLTGNGLDIRTNFYSSDVMPTGLAVTIASGVAGAGVVNIAGLIAAWGDIQYHTIVCPWTDGATLQALAVEMATRRGGMVMKDGIVWFAAKGSQGALAALGEGAENSPDFSIPEAVGPVTVWERAAKEAAVCDLSLGIDPSQPTWTLPLSGDLAPNPSERFTQPERNALLYDGISTHTVDDGGNVLIERSITTYLTNAAGAPDPSYLNVTTMATLSYLRYTLVVRFAQKFPRAKLANNGIAVAPGQTLVTTNTLTAELIAIAREWEKAGLVEDVDTFKSLLVVQRNDENDEEVDAVIPPDLVSGLGQFNAQIQFAF